MKIPYLLLVFAFSTAVAMAQQPERTLSADSIITTDGRLDSLYQSLPEIMVTGERPIVKSQQGKLVYDLPRLIRNLPVDNAYDAVKELPGVAEVNGSITLGGMPVTIVLNGKVTTLSTEQLNALLRSTPASRIENAEVMYNAPARYQVRGALINITLKQHSGAQSLQGELYGKFAQQYYEGTNGRISLLYGSGKFSTDLLYSYNYDHSYRNTLKTALHTLADGTVYPISNDENSRYRQNLHDVRWGADYNFGENHTLSAVYTGSYGNVHNWKDIHGSQKSDTYQRSPDQLHNVRVDYQAPFGLRAGVETTYYHSGTVQWLNSAMEGETMAFRTEDSQRINSWKFFLAQEHSLGKGWGVNYGGVYSTAVDNSYQYYYDAQSGGGAVIPDNMRSRRREQTLNLYGGFNKSFGKFSLDASLAVEHYQTSVWDKWDWYPVLNLTYMLTPGNIWMLALSSDKNYPGYWAVQNAVSYLGGTYSEVQGNPLLRPSQAYQLSLTRIFRGKYVFQTWFTHTKDYSTQLLYQSSQRLVEIYKYINFNYSQQAGVQASLPFDIQSWLSSRLTLTGVWQHERADDFWDMPFDRAIFWGMANLTNTFTLSSKPDLKLTLTGMIRSTAHQGLYDLPSSGNVNVALRYGFADGNGIINLYANDLFETGGISPRIRYKTQNVTNHYSTFREVGVSLTWKFGGYKEKKREEVDRSRFK
ncbi:MAG: outer membrane beta-barrel protein [Mediterranea sp.]|nr:outer membrane beta-barrel protein [Mediterranea sp.]